MAGPFDWIDPTIPLGDDPASLAPKFGKPIGPETPSYLPSPESPKPQGSTYLDFVRKQEGFNPRAYGDYKQTSIGYGTRARPGETSITREEGERRLGEELDNARRLVRGFGVKLSPRQEDALTDLTYNAGGSWMTSGLGAAVKAGDWQRAADIYRQYNKAGGQTLPGLVNRRNAAAPWLLDTSGAAPQITAQEALPTSMTSSPGQPRGRGMLDFIKGMFGSPAAASEAQQPVTAESIIANLDRLGVAKDDPMRGTYEYLAQSLAGGRKPQPEMAGWQKGLGVFADTLGAGLGRRGGNSAAQPIFMDMLKQQDADRKALEDRQYQAPLQLIQSTMPYRMKDVERQRHEKMIQSILGPQAPGGAAPIAPGGAQGVQMAPAPTPGTAPVTPVQRGPLPPPGVGLPPEELGDRPGGPPAAGLPAAPAIPQPQAAAPGGLTAPQQQALPPSAPTQGAAPSGPAGPGSKFRITPEEVEKRFPLPHDLRRITAMSAYDDKMADNMRQQNELALKQREQFLKLYEVGRSTDDPESTKAKETAKLDAKREGDLATMRQKGGLAIKGIGSELQALVDLANSGKLTSGAIGPWDASDEPIVGGPAGWIAPSGKTMGRILNSFDPGEWGGANPEQQRALIEQGQMGILNVAKKLVREAGEGTFSEGDQQLLNKLVGELPQARNLADFKERVANLREVMQRVFAAPLGLELPKLTMEKGQKAGEQAQPAAKSAASEPVGATRTINGQPYTKTPQGWVPASAGAAPQPPQAPEPPAGGMTPQQQAVMDQMKRLGIDPATAMGGR